MPHVIFSGTNENAVAGAAVAADATDLTSLAPDSKPTTLSLETGPESVLPTPRFNKKSDKKRINSNLNDKGIHQPAVKRIRTFYAQDEDDADEGAEENSGFIGNHTSNGTGNGNGKGKTDDKNQAKKRLQRERKERSMQLLSGRTKLPVWYAKDKILEEIDKRDTVVILGETGSGKTTQIPQFILASNICRSEPRICVTQPRRVAATSLARRVSEEVGCSLGGLVGYTVRFDDCSSPKSRLKYVTDGTLLQEMLEDPLLKRYDVVVIDEAHERTLRTDMILGFLKEIQKRRKSMANADEEQAKSGERVGVLKIAVMSATLDAQRFSKFYDDAQVLYIKGREHKVQIKYLDKPIQDYLEGALKTIFQIHYMAPPGDVLVFLSGQEDIESLRLQIESFLPTLDQKKMQILICPLYARLTSVEQNKAFSMAPPNTRKIILATNVAETSITISGIKYVIDTGLAKEKLFHPTSGMDSLLLSPISKSSATQRAGRAGRESTGVCYRLYTEGDYHNLRQAVPPEIQRCSLSFALLHLLASGQEDVFQFEYMDRPDDEAIAIALMELVGLGAIDERGKINETGRKMVSLPLEPRQAKTLLASFEHGCTLEIVDLLALLGSADQLLAVPFAQRDEAAVARSNFIHRSGDHMMLLNILHAFEDFSLQSQVKPTQKEKSAWCKHHFLSLKTINQILEARKQIRERVERMGLDWRRSSKDSDEPVLLCLLAGHFPNTAMRMPDNTYRRTSGAMKIKIHPSSILQGKQVDAIVFSELVFTTSVYARLASSIPLIWLRNKINPFFRHRNVTDQQAIPPHLSSDSL